MKYCLLKMCCLGCCLGYFHTHCQVLCISYKYAATWHCITDKSYIQVSLLTFSVISSETICIPCAICNIFSKSHFQHVWIFNFIAYVLSITWQQGNQYILQYIWKNASTFEVNHTPVSVYSLNPGSNNNFFISLINKCR